MRDEEDVILPNHWLHVQSYCSGGNWFQKRH